MAVYESPLLKSLNYIEHGFQDPDHLKPEKSFACHQVHGTDAVLLHNHSNRHATSEVKADGLLTMYQPSLAVQTADCLPVLFASKSYPHAVAAVHAGWKGTLAGILPKVVKRMTEHFEIKASDLVVAIGPSIQKCCFEINEDLKDQFESRWGFLWVEGENKPFFYAQPTSNNPKLQAPKTNTQIWLDLSLVAIRQLADSGVKEENIDVLSICTYCSGKNFASYRRSTHEKATPHDAKRRQWSFIHLKSE